MEVKHRSHNTQGSGVDYIAPKKLKQIQFAAALWVQQNDWQGDYCLGGIELSGPDYQVSAFLRELSVF